MGREVPSIVPLTWADVHDDLDKMILKCYAGGSRNGPRQRHEAWISVTAADFIPFPPLSSPNPKGKGMTTTEIPEAEQLGEDYDWQDAQPEESQEQVFTIFDAPDYASWFKVPRTATAKDCEDRVGSMLKAAAIGALRNGMMADAAALIDHGPGFAKAAGAFADKNETAHKAILAATTPGSPAGLFASAAIGLIGQLMRNHQEEFSAAKAKAPSKEQRKAIRAEAKAEAKAKPPRFKIKFLRWEIPIRVQTPKVGKIFGAFLVRSSQDPGELTIKVFSNDKLVSQLDKIGVHVNITTVPR